MAQFVVITQNHWHSAAGVLSSGRIFKVLMMTEDGDAIVVIDDYGTNVMIFSSYFRLISPLEALAMEAD